MTQTLNIDKLSSLIREAVGEIDRLVKLPDYFFNIWSWVGYEASGCYFCVAGALMLKLGCDTCLKLKHKLGEDLSNKLLSLNEVRNGGWWQVASVWGIPDYVVRRLTTGQGLELYYNCLEPDSSPDPATLDHLEFYNSHLREKLLTYAQILEEEGL